MGHLSEAAGFYRLHGKCDLLLGPRKLVEPSLSFNNNYHQARN